MLVIELMKMLLLLLLCILIEKLLELFRGDAVVRNVGDEGASVPSVGAIKGRCRVVHKLLLLLLLLL